MYNVYKNRYFAFKNSNIIIEEDHLKEKRLFSMKKI